LISALSWRADNSGWHMQAFSTVKNSTN
jgi:hypothetical protein